MTNKEQIIIDGVDVKDCRRRIGKNSYCRYFKRLWSDNNVNCVWKQLARKTQECEELKNELDLYKTWYRAKHDDVKNLLGCYRKALEEIELTIKNLEKGDILTFPDFTLQENTTMIINQCNQGYRDILDIINKAKGEGNE